MPFTAIAMLFLNYIANRLVQMMLVRLVGQGRLCECLKDDDEALAIDIFMRQLGLAKMAREEVGRLDEQVHDD